MCVPECSSECSGLGRPEEGMKSFGAVVQGSFELSSVGARTELHLLQEQYALFSAAPLQPLAHLVFERIPLAFMLSELVSKQKTSCLYYSMMSQLCL